MNVRVEESLLGKKTDYIVQYTPDLLYPISRQASRDQLGISNPLPFQGADIWNGFELSWLNGKGKPMVAVAEFLFPCTSPHLIESKSFKLYLNSFNQSIFLNVDDVLMTLRNDLSRAAGEEICVKLIPVSDYKPVFSPLEGYCLDGLDITCDRYEVTPDFLQVGKQYVEEILYSHLLKSNCPVTGQPDWASVQIRYTGRKIDHEGLLKYWISFRNHNEFHEQCVEQIFMDVMMRCQPEKLTVHARYTRRGGLDINPYRSTEEGLPDNFRLVRQ